MHTRRIFLKQSIFGVSLAAGGNRIAGAGTAATRVALILTGSITDGGWNQGAYEGLVALEAKGGFETVFVERASQVRIPQLAQGFADDNFDLIIGHGFEFQSAFLDLAPDYPDRNFFVSSFKPEGEIPNNLMFVDLTLAECAYGAGTLAGLISHSGRAVGFVGGADNPIQQKMMRSFVAAAESIRPGAKGLGIVTGDYDNAARGKEAAETLIANGADVIWHAAGVTGLGAIQGAFAKGVKAIGAYGDQKDVAPSIVATSFLLNVPQLVIQAAEFQRTGTFKGRGEWAPRVTELWSLRAADKGEYDSTLVTKEQWKRFATLWSALGERKVDLSKI